VYNIHNHFRIFASIGIILLVIGCTPAQKTLDNRLAGTPVPVAIPTLPNPTGTPAVFPSPTTAFPTQPPQTIEPGSAASIEMPSLTPFPPTKPSSFPEREVNPTPGNFDASTITVLTYTPAMPHGNAGFYDGDLLYFLGSAWQDKKPWSPDTIFTYNFKTGGTSKVTTSVLGEKGVIDTMAASQEWLSWDTHSEWGGGWRLFARNLKTGQEILVDREEDANYKTLRGPYTGISGSQLVWSSMRKNAAGVVKSTVMLIDLDKGEKNILVEDSAYFFGYVGIDAGRVVWSKGQFNSDEVNVYLHDLKTGTTTQLTDDDRSYQPQIRGDWIVWRHGFDQTGPISIYNLKTGERIRLNAEGDFLRMGDGMVLWWTYRDPSAYIYDIRNNILYPNSTSHEFSPPMYIYGRSIVAETVPEQGTGKNKLVVQIFPP
jgi:hypothetical protein